MMHFSTSATLALAVVCAGATFHYAVDALRSTGFSRVGNEFAAAAAAVWTVLFLNGLIQAAVTVTK